MCMHQFTNDVNGNDSDRKVNNVHISEENLIKVLSTKSDK